MPELKAELKLATNNFVKSLDDAVKGGSANFASILEAAKKFDVEINSKIPAGLRALTNSMSETKKLATNFEESKKQLQSFVAEQRLALAEMHLMGNAGTDAFKKIEKEIENAESKLKKYDAAQKATSSAAAAPVTTASPTGGIMSKMAGSLGSGMALAGGMLGAQALAGGISSIAEKMIQGNQEFETFETQLTTIMGSSKAAKVELEKLAEFGAKTPFDLPEVVRADKVLLGFGFNTAKTTQLAKMNMEEFRTTVGDIAAGTGAGFEEIALLMGKFGSGATGEAIARFQELGIVTKEQLAEMGVKFDKAGSLLSPLPMAFEATMKLAKEKFGGGMDKLSATAEGQMSNLQDNIDQILRKIGEPLFNVFKNAVVQINNFLSSSGVQAVVNFLRNSIPPELINSIVTGLGLFVGIIGTLVIAVKLWALAQWALNIAMSANPIGIIIVAIAGLAVGIYALYKNFAPVRNAIDGIIGGFKIMWSVLKAVGITIYEFVKTYFLTYFNVAKQAVETIAAVIGKLLKFDFAGAVDEAKKGGSKLFNTLTTNAIESKNNVSKAWGEVGNTVSDVMNTATESVKKKSGDIKKALDNAIPPIKTMTIELALSQNSINKFSEQFQQLQSGRQAAFTGIDQTKAMVDMYIANPELAKAQRQKLQGELDVAKKQQEAFLKDGQKAQADKTQTDIKNITAQIYIMEHLKEAQNKAGKESAKAFKEQNELETVTENNKFRLDIAKQTELKEKKKKILEEIANIKESLARKEILTNDELYEKEKKAILDKQEVDKAGVEAEIKTLKAGKQTLEVQSQIAIKRLELEKLLVTQQKELQDFETKRGQERYKETVDKEQARADRIISINKELIKTLEAMPVKREGDVLQLGNSKVDDIRNEGIKQANAFIEGLTVFQDKKKLIEKNLELGNIMPEDAIKQINDLRNKLTTELSTGAIKGYDDAAIAYRNITNNTNKAILDQQIKNAQALKEFRIGQIGDIDEQELQFALLALTKKYNADQEAAGENQSLLLSNWQQFLDAKLALEEAYAYKTRGIYYQLGEDLKESFTSVFAEMDWGGLFKGADKEVEKTQKAEIESMNKQSKELKRQLDKNEITYDEYAEKQADISKQRADKEAEIEKNKVTIWTKVNSVFFAGAGKLMDKYTKAFDKDIKENVDITQTLGDAYKMVGVSMFQAMAGGQDMLKATAQTILGILPQILMAYSSQIFGAFVSLGPWMIPVALGAIATMYGLSKAAYGGDSGIWSVGSDNQSPSSRDVYPRMLRKGERVFTPEMLEGNERIAAAIFAGNKLDKGGTQASSHNFAFQHEFSNAKVTAKQIEWAVTKSQRARLRSIG